LQWKSDSNGKQAAHGIAALHEKELWKPSPVHCLGRGILPLKTSILEPQVDPHIITQGPCFAVLSVFIVSLFGIYIQCKGLVSIIVMLTW
jgi:hypothetical protein